MWHYNFLRRPPIRADSGLIERPYAAAFHGAELPYLFGTYDVRDWPWTDADHRLGRQLRAAWLSFVATGDPSAEGAPAWPQFSEHVPSTLVWDLPSPRVADVPYRDRMAVFDEFNRLTASG